MQAPQSTDALRLSRPQTLALRRFYRGGQWRRNVAVTTPWGRGVGKSTFLRFLAYLLVQAWDGRMRPGADKPGVRIVVMLPTLKQAKRIHVNNLQVELATRWKHLDGSWNGQDFCVTFPGGSTIQFVSAEQGTTIAGLRCDAILADECDDLDIEMYDALAAPWLSETHSLQLRLFSGTPRRGRYGLLYKRHRMGAIDNDPRSYSYHATYRDVPEYVDAAYVDGERRTMDPALFAREWLCDFDSAEGLVYPMFEPALHVREPDPRARPTATLVGVDHGWEDPGVFLVVEVYGSGKDAVCHVVHEVHAKHKVEGWWVEQAKAIKANWPSARWYADPSQPARIEALRRGAGISIEGADNAIEDGVSAVAERLAIRETSDGEQFARLYISRDCKNLIREMGLYRRKRDPRNHDRILDDIQDRDNHCFAAGTLVTTDRGDVAIETIQAGDRVLTRDGFHVVKAAGQTGVEPTHRLTLSDGTTIDATANHRFWVDGSGWTRVDALHSLDALIACDTENVLVVDVGAAGPRRPVFCLTVDGPPEFFANGVLVHNCQDAIRYPIFSHFGRSRRAADGDQHFGFG